MKKYIVFLRGINVSGQKVIKMADLKLLLEPDFGSVITYIQSGNLVITSGKSPKEITGSIQKSIEKQYGFSVPVLVLSRETVEAIVAANPFKNEEEKCLYFCLPVEQPEEELKKRFSLLSFENEQFYVAKDCIYFNCTKGYGKAKLNNNYVEQKLNIAATTRNLKTMLKMLTLST